MKFKLFVNIWIVVSWIIALILVIWTFSSHTIIHKIDKKTKYQGSRNKFFETIASIIDKSINHITWIIGFIIRGTLLRKYFNQQILFIWIISIIVVYIIVNIIKILSKKQRPSDAKYMHNDFSFPSGHTAFSTTGFLNIALAIGSLFSLPYLTSTLFFLAILWGGIVGRSRRYLKIHRISDIITGRTLGTFCFLLSYSVIYSYFTL